MNHDPLDGRDREREHWPLHCETLAEYIDRVICRRFKRSNGQYAELNFDGQLNRSFYIEPSYVFTPLDFKASSIRRTIRLSEVGDDDE